MMSKDDFRQVVAEFYDKWQSSNETTKKLDEVKFYRGIVVGLIIGIVGSLLSSFKTLNNVLICVGIGAVMVLVMILVPLTLQINDKDKRNERGLKWVKLCLTSHLRFAWLLDFLLCIK